MLRFSKMIRILTQHISTEYDGEISDFRFKVGKQKPKHNEEILQIVSSINILIVSLLFHNVLGKKKNNNRSSLNHDTSTTYFAPKNERFFISHWKSG